MTAARDPVVLVVDDDPVIRRTLKRGLERDGFQVLEAEDGVQALAVHAASPARVDVLLTDVVMPQMGGVALAERLLQADDPPAIMLMSGMTHDPARLVVAGQRPVFLPKPFDLNAVTNRLRSLLGIG